MGRLPLPAGPWLGRPLEQGRMGETLLRPCPFCVGRIGDMERMGETVRMGSIGMVVGIVAGLWILA